MNGKKRKKWKSILSLILSLIMGAGMMPITSFAVENDYQKVQMTVAVAVNTNDSNSKWLELKPEDLNLTPGDLELTPNQTDGTVTETNSTNLQTVINAVSKSAPGGMISIPAGKFYFKGIKKRKTGAVYNEGLNTACIEMMDNVTLSGTIDPNGNALTTLLPYGTETIAYDFINNKEDPHSKITSANACSIPNNMFQHIGQEFSKGVTYCSNFNVQNLIVDCSNISSSCKYNSMSKGFAGAFLYNCKFINVTVKGAEGSGFGVDCLKQCVFDSCTAIECGRKMKGIKDATGASGFGIGYGYDGNESCYIVNCKSINNTKFGFFFESQCRFNPSIDENKSASGDSSNTTNEGFWKNDTVSGKNEYIAGHDVTGLVVENCYAHGNLYNFGGEYCKSATFINNSTVKIPEKLQAPNNKAILPSGQELLQEPAPSNYTRYDYWFDENSAENSIYEDNKKLSIQEANPNSIFYTDITYNSTEQVNDWYFDPINVLSRERIISGYNPDGTSRFGVRDTMARAQFIVMLYRLAGEPMVTYQNIFTDVPNGTWYTNAAIWAKEKGISTGYTNSGGTVFGVNDPLTREQMVTFLWRYAGHPEISSAASDSASDPASNSLSYTAYIDRDQVSGFAEAAMKWAVENSIIAGENNLLRPSDAAIRAEAAKVIYSYMVIYKLTKPAELYFKECSNESYYTPSNFR